MANKIVEWTGSPLVDERRISKADWDNVGVDHPGTRWVRLPGPTILRRYEAGGHRFSNPAVEMEWSEELEAYFATDAAFTVHDPAELAQAKKAKAEGGQK